MSRRTVNNWKPIKGQPLTELDKKILYIQNKGHLVPTRKLIKTPEQIEGIRRSSVINTGVLDLIQKEIKEGMSTAVIDKLVYDYTVGHGAIPAPLNYEGFPKSVCTSINEVVCHGIPSDFRWLLFGCVPHVHDRERISGKAEIGTGRQGLSGDRYKSGEAVRIRR